MARARRAECPGSSLSVNPPLQNSDGARRAGPGTAPRSSRRRWAVVVVKAGTGKTRVLRCARVARLSEAGVVLERILPSTLTCGAAFVMPSRAPAMCGDAEAAERIACGTFDVVADRIVAEHVQHLGLEDVTVDLDPDDVIDLIDPVRAAEHGLDTIEARTVDDTHHPRHRVPCEKHRDPVGAVIEDIILGGARARRRDPRSLSARSTAISAAKRGLL